MDGLLAPQGKLDLSGCIQGCTEGIILPMDSVKRLFPLFGLLVLLLPARLAAQTPESVVHAVLFYHPTCPHCHQLITQYLIPLQEEHGRRLVILGMDTSQEWANNLYWEAIRYYEVPEDDWAVPMLVVGEQVFVGGLRIPNGFTPILEAGLAGDGVDLPSFPALVNFLREQDALDPRYPDRLIARQAPVPEGEEALPEEEPAEAGEEPLQGDTAAPLDTGVVDTAAVRVVDTAAVRVVDTAAVRVVDTAAARAVDTAAARAAAPEEARQRTVEDSAAAQPPVPPPTEQAGDTSPRAEVTGAPQAVQTPVAETPPTPDPARRDPEGMDLAQAARELESMTMWDRFNLDRVGNALSVLVLVMMVVGLILRGYPPRVGAKPWPSWVIPTLILVGAGVAAYLSYIEVTQGEAVCGPVGDCNTVNQSEYATLFGLLPVGVLGLMGYGTMLVLWVLRHAGTGPLPRVATLGLWGAALLGTLFSVYLTFLEPFVIGATCAWCLTSAVVMTLLLLASSPLAAAVWKGRGGSPRPA